MQRRKSIQVKGQGCGKKNVKEEGNWDENEDDD
jgi:hypothetical protein